MLPLPIFRHHAPRTVDETVRLIGELPEAKLIAGGTDLLPNMKHGLVEPQHLISLGDVDELHGIRLGEDHIEIGATTRLVEIAESHVVRQHAPAMAKAMGLVGGPHHRQMGTLGGNVCLDTRCVYYNQTYFWREALGFCLKKDGTQCHVVSSGKNCVAAASNDSAPVMMVLGATIVLRSQSRGERVVEANDFYLTDGIYNVVKEPDELVTAVRFPIVPNRKSAYEKLRRRGAIDYPLLNAAVRFDMQDDGTIAAADLVVSTLAARPKRVKAAAKLKPGAEPDEALFTSLADAAYKQCKPLTNCDNDPAWRRDMVRVLVKKALTAAAG